MTDDLKPLTDAAIEPEVNTAPVEAEVISADVPSETPAEVPIEAPVDVVIAEKPADTAGGRGRGGMGGRGGMRGGMGGRGRGGPGFGNRGPRKTDGVPMESDYDEKNLEIARVTRVTKGGKRMRFRALTVIGNHKGRVGFGVAKGLDVAAATGKATTKARKALMTVPIVKETIPHSVIAKFAAARVLLKPAPKGTGVKAGGSVRVVLELAGIPNVVSKSLGSKNKINNVKATFAALKMLRSGGTSKSSASEPSASSTV